ncbi:MAG: VPLPA-CTERM sorting domain-containing protein [Silicimonas sp.]|nr:VPLPA-CTERM sorting domain-containing protein [Silicimonas sp.]
MLLVGAAGAAQAATFSGIASGTWSNPDASYGYSISNNDLGGTADVNWGKTSCLSCTDFDNLWSFDGIGSDGGQGWSANAGDVFSFGNFTYRNGSVNGHDFEGADLDVTLQIMSPIGLNQTFDFEFDVVNTPNTSGNPVTDGDTADIIGSVSNQSFMYGGNEYTLELIGFSQDVGTTPTTGFNSPEGSTSSAALYGRINQVDNPPEVPLPAAGWLLVAGMGGLAGLRRMQKG